MPVYSVIVRQNVCLNQKTKIIVYAANEDEVRTAIDDADDDFPDMTWQEDDDWYVTGRTCYGMDITICDDEVSDIGLLVAKNSDGEPEITQITPISSAMITEIANSIDHDDITLIDAIGLFKSKQ